MSSLRRIAVIGPGRVGSFWTRAALKQGFQVDLRARTPQNCPADLVPHLRALPMAPEEAQWADYDLVLLSVADEALEDLCLQIHDAAILGEPQSGPLIAHASGALAPDILIRCGVPASRAIAAHPLFPFNSPDTSPSANQVFHAVEGDLDAVNRMGTIIRETGGAFFILEEVNRPLYHLACVLASNHLVTLFHAAQHLFELSTGSQVVPHEAIYGLMKESLKNLSQTKPEAALTGPALRGDVPAISRHFSALEEYAPEYQRLYENLLNATLPVIPENARASVTELLEKRSSQ